MEHLPAEIVTELLKQQDAMGWPDTVWTELPDASGVDKYHRYQDMTIGLCEQAVEHHSRVARLILSKEWWRRPGKVEDAARHILLARLFRCRYIELTGEQDSTEDDMPFAYSQW